VRELLAPRWLAAHVVVVVVAVVFVNLGLWQLGRLEERQLENTVGEARYLADPIALNDLLAATQASDVDSLEYRRVIVDGAFIPSQEVLIRSQVYRGEAGFHVITPLLHRSGVVLVNRGWVPLVLDQVPVTQAPPPVGKVEVRGWLSLTEERGPLGPEDPAGGRLTTMNRIDIDRIQQQIISPLAPLVINLLEDGEAGIPIAIAAPTFEDEGPHLAYAIQWFGFALIGIVGYFFLIRRTVKRSG